MYWIMVPSMGFSREYVESDLRRIVKRLILKGITSEDTLYFYKQDVVDGRYSPTHVPKILQGLL